MRRSNEEKFMALAGEIEGHLTAGAARPLKRKLRRVLNLRRKIEVSNWIVDAYCWITFSNAALLVGWVGKALEMADNAIAALRPYADQGSSVVDGLWGAALWTKPATRTPLIGGSQNRKRIFPRTIPYTRV